MIDQNQPWVIVTALSKSIENNNFMCVREIVAVLTQHPSYVTEHRDLLNKKLSDAAERGATECVRELLQVSDPKYQRNHPLFEAAFMGNVECVKLLLPVSDPLFHNQCLLMVAYNGEVGVLRVLMEVCDPKADNSEALYNAIVTSRKECIDLLLPVSDCEVVLEKLEHDHPNSPYLYEPLQHALAQRQKQVLEKTLDGIPAVARVRKI